MAITTYESPSMGLRWTDGNQVVEFEAHGDAVAMVCVSAIVCFALFAVARSAA